MIFGAFKTTSPEKVAHLQGTELLSNIPEENKIGSFEVNVNSESALEGFVGNAYTALKSFAAHPVSRLS